MQRHHLWLLAAACLACLTLSPPLPRLPACQPPVQCPAAVADMGSHDGKLRLRVVTLNTWGLWLVSRRREERMAALADWLRSPNCPADVVALQEVWVLADVARLRQAGAEGGALPHSFHYQSGALGSGLLLLSRFPLSEVAFHPYSARGDPAAVLQGDYYVGKGVGWAALQTPAGTLSVFLTHLSANYGQEWQVGAFRLAPDCRLPRDNLAGVRLLQVAELAAFVRARGAGSPAGVVLAGDLNCAPDTLEFAMLRVLLPELRDAWADAQPLLLGATANALESSFTTAGAGHRPIRIDYILATGRALHADLALTDTGLGFSYSDHLGVAATLDMPGSSSDGNDSRKGSRGSKSSSSSPTADGGKQQVQQGGQLAPPPAALRLMRPFPEPFHEATAQIEEAAAVMARGRRHAVGFAAGLFAAGFGCLGALAARAWVQPGPAPGWQAGDNYLLLLGGMGAALGWAGVVLVGGFVARGSELRALQQAALQLRLAVGTAACKPFS